ncbi:hypothetical protein [Streptomyces sp. MAI_2237]
MFTQLGARSRVALARRLEP